ncbi:TPA: methyltransferase domain-containing protein [Candidatus Poribacteria bacterium]|nr:methyltransferase domain-containing protein [Candidatus Poribacteria bacterium]
MQSNSVEVRKLDIVKKRGRTFLGALGTMIRKKAQGLCRNKTGKLMDVGCGNGLFFAALQEEKGLQFFGLDIYDEFLKEAKVITDDKPILIQGEMGKLPFKDNSFDIVVCLNTLFNQPSILDVETGLTEMMRVCKRTGRIIVDVRNKANPYIRLKYWWHMRRGDFPTMTYYISDFQSIFERHGFEIVRREPVGIPNGIAAFAFVLEASSVEQ